MTKNNLRESLEAWEHEAAAYWDNLTRSPEFLNRVGLQITRSLESQQRIMSSVQNAFLRSANSQDQIARELYLLERLEKQIETLTARIEALETALRHE